MSARVDPPAQNQRRGSDFWLLLLLFFSFRWLSLLFLRPGGFIRDWSDFDTFLGIAALSDYGRYPFLDFWLEWPPPVPWLMVGAYRLSLLFPAWEGPRFWFVTILGAVFLLFETGNFVLIDRLARRLYPDPARSTRVLWLYAGLFPPVYAMLGFFDALALFFILLALDQVLARRLLPAAAVAGLGFVVKLTPILMLPLALKRIWETERLSLRAVRRGMVVVVVCLGAAWLVFLPFLLLAPQWVTAFGRAVAGRSSWETVWAVLEGYYGFGFVAGDRLNPAETNFAIHAATLPWGLISLGFVLLYSVLFFLKVDVSRPRPLVALAGLTVTVFLLYSKGYSPQFLVYVLPFIILLLPNGAGLGYALLLTALNFLEQPIYFVFFPPDQFPAQTWLLTAIVSARFGVWLALSLEFLWLYGDWSPQRWRRGLRLTLAGGALVGALWLAPNLWGAYREVQLARHPDRALIAFLQTQVTRPPTALLLTDQARYQRLYPYLGGEFELRLAGEAGQFAASTTVELVAGQKQVWFLPDGAAGEAVGAALDGLGRPLGNYHFAESGSLTLFDLAGAEAGPVVAQAANGIRLLAYRWEKRRDRLVVTLFWQTSQPLETDYTVFTQLLDPAGRLAAGHDSPPAGGARPTTAWQPEQVIVDRHEIVWPDELPPGQYRLLAGMYDANLARLPLAAADGSPYPDGAMGLGAVEWP